MMPYTVHSSRNKLDEDPHIEKTNNENEDRLWRYNNSFKVGKLIPPGMNVTDDTSVTQINMSSDLQKLTSLGVSATPIARIPPLTLTELEQGDSDDSSPGHFVPSAIRKVQNADMERNITPHGTNCKSVQKEIYLKSKPVSLNSHEKTYRSSEIVV